MSKVYVFLANGFEEIEGLTVVDLLRRSGIDTIMVSITGERMVSGSHNISVLADVLFEEEDFREGEMLVLPGGMPGTLHLGEHEGLISLLKMYEEQQKKIAAICAAPSVLGSLGILSGKRAVCYPGMEEKMVGAFVGDEAVVVDGRIITSRGLGTAIEFSLELIKQLRGKEAADKVQSAIVYK